MSGRIWVAVLALVGTVLGISGSSTDHQKKQVVARPIKPVVYWSGADSRIDEAEYLRITNAKDWRALWRRHHGKKTPRNENAYYTQGIMPEIDFDQCMVVAVFGGGGWNSAGIRFINAAMEEGTLHFRFDNRFYQTGGPDGGGERCTAYGLFVVPRIEADIVLEQVDQESKKAMMTFIKRGTLPYPVDPAEK